jgi:hypothetical protein
MENSETTTATSPEKFSRQVTRAGVTLRNLLPIQGAGFTDWKQCISETIGL